MYYIQYNKVLSLPSLPRGLDTLKKKTCSPPPPCCTQSTRLLVLKVSHTLAHPVAVLTYNPRRVPTTGVDSPLPRILRSHRCKLPGLMLRLRRHSKRCQQDGQVTSEQPSTFTNVALHFGHAHILTLSAIDTALALEHDFPNASWCPSHWQLWQTFRLQQPVVMRGCAVTNEWYSAANSSRCRTFFFEK